LAEKAKEQNPRDPYVHSDLALYYAKTGNSEMAVQHQQTAVVLAPDSGEILAAAAEAFEVLGMRDEAVDLALRALAAGLDWQWLSRNVELQALLTDPRMADSR
jgi:Flp pilus assembly protein TadD